MASAPLYLLSAVVFATNGSNPLCDEKRTPAWWAACDAREVLSTYLFESAGAFQASHPRRESSWTESCRLLAHYVSEVFHNPFRPVTVNPSWLTSTVVTLADTIYADRAFDRLPILADALQDAGCEDADILAHCRGPGPHVRGCWAVDLVLGK